MTFLFGTPFAYVRGVSIKPPTLTIMDKMTAEQFFSEYQRLKKFNEHLHTLNDATAHFLQEVGQLETIKYYNAMNAKNPTQSEKSNTQTMMKQMTAFQPGRLIYVALTSECIVHGMSVTFTIEHTAFHITRKDKSLADIYQKASELSVVFYKSFESIFNSIVDLDSISLKFGDRFLRDLFSNLTLEVYPITADDYNEKNDRYFKQALDIEKFIPYHYVDGNPLKQYSPDDVAQIQAIMLLGLFLG